MKQRLQQNLVSLIHDSLKDNVVLRTVDTSCKQFESRMNVMRFSTTEIYIESVSLLDEIRRLSTDFDFPNAYDNLLCQLRNYDESNENVDARLAASVIIVFTAYIIFICFSVNEHYKYWALDLLKTVPKEADHKNMLKLIASRLSESQQDKLREYMCSYIKQSDRWLSDDIRTAVLYDGLDKELIEELKPIFFSDNQQQNIVGYIKEVSTARKDMEVSQITARYIKKKIISDYGNSFKGDLWLILHNHNLYRATKDNWCKALNRIR